jgi:4-carboxymuconolactone decarboxylase
MADNKRFNDGMKTRREVLGDAHVDAATKSATDLDRDFQEFLTRYAWGEIWSREGLPRTTRSIVTVALLVALNREEELRMHLRAALRNGVTHDELKEVLMHCGIYCGLPAANGAFKIAREVLAEGK